MVQPIPRLPEYFLSAIGALKCHRKSGDSGVSDERFRRANSGLGKAQIQLDGAQIQLGFAHWRRRFDFGRSHKVSYAKIPRCSATMKLRVRIASWRNVPEDAIVASFILLPRGRTVGTGEAGRGAGRGCATTCLPRTGWRARSPYDLCRVDPRRMIRRSKQQRACLLAAPGFEAALKRSQQLVRVRARIFRL